MIRADEWLQDAKRLPIGGEGRVNHGAERRPNMVVKNLVDRYTCYCHSCDDGAVVMKEVVKLVKTPPPPKDMKPTSPGFIIPVMNLDLARVHDLCKFLHSKDMAWVHITESPMQPSLSVGDQRLVFITPDQVVGRDLSGKSKAKWYTYSSNVSFNRAAFETFRDKHVIVTEDYFSAIKGQYAFRDDPTKLFVSSMGTKIHADLSLELVKAKRVTMLYDGDKAGYEGAQKGIRALKMLGTEVNAVFPPEGKDPKNMQHDWFLDNLR